MSGGCFFQLRNSKFMHAWLNLLIPVRCYPQPNYSEELEQYPTEKGKKEQQ
jgi:hypothetical protein